MALDVDAADRDVVELFFAAELFERVLELVAAVEAFSSSAAAAFSSVVWDAVVGTMTFRLGRVKAMG
ncbi:hypothetical protein GCM10027060_04440 [Nesterenkonia halophila]|uniref:Uncharacterized protein n=1 Tax=Nesterenkonia halobia TaxID=37922 RepID=A0ABP6RDR0_9MICC